MRVKKQFPDNIRSQLIINYTNGGDWPSGIIQYLVLTRIYRYCTLPHSRNRRSESNPHLRQIDGEDFCLYVGLQD
jgi:hypothetical protein